MSYLHCHNPKCSWSQDDFWNWKFRGFISKSIVNNKWHIESRPFGYNPISLIWQDLFEYVKPRYIGMDSSYWYDRNLPCPENRKIHSWSLMYREIKRHIKRIFTQTYWTYSKWYKLPKDKRWICPRCKEEELDID